MKKDIFKDVQICNPQKKLKMTTGQMNLPQMLTCVAPTDLPLDETQLIEIQKYLVTPFDHTNPYHIFLIELLLIYDKGYLDDFIKPDSQGNYLNFQDQIQNKLNLNDKEFKAQYSKKAFRNLGFQREFFLTDLRDTNILSLLGQTQFCTFQNREQFVNTKKNITNRFTFAVTLINFVGDLSQALRLLDGDSLSNNEPVPEHYIKIFTYASKQLKYNLKIDKYLEDLILEKSNESISAIQEYNKIYFHIYKNILGESNILYLEFLSIMCMQESYIQFQNEGLINELCNTDEFIHLKEINQDGLIFHQGFRFIQLDTNVFIKKLLVKWLDNFETLADTFDDGIDIIKDLRNTALKEIQNVQFVQKCRDFCIQAQNEYKKALGK